MQEKDREFFGSLLMELRKSVLEQIGTVKKKEMDSTLKDEDGDLSGYSYHLADQGTDNNDCEQRFLSAERDSELLHEIEEALKKILDGTYGRCEKCGNDIGWYRLEAVPYARLCIGCKAREESDSMNRTKEGYTRRVFPSREIHEQEEEYEELY